MIGWMAGSLAGHDKNKIYIIIEETQDYVLLCDGDIRLLDNPKRKKKKHIQDVKPQSFIYPNYMHYKRY